MIILVVVHGGNITSYAEYKPTNGEYRAVWGWQGSRLELAAPKRSHPDPTPGPVHHAPPVPGLPARTFPTLVYRWFNGKRVAPVRLMFEDIGKSVSNIGRECHFWRGANSQDVGDVFTMPRNTAKKGGRKVWVATEGVLTRMHRHF